MNHGKSTYLLLFGIVLPLLFLPGCATTKGKVSDGNYYAPLNNFVMPLPRLQPMFGGLRVQDENDEEGGMVSVHDDVGNNQGVTYVRLPANAETVHSDPAKRDSAYRSFVHDYALPSLFRPVSSQSKIVREEFLYSGPDQAFFAVVVIPEGSTLMDVKTGKRLESIRALLVFDKNGFIYMLHVEMNTAFDGVDAASLAVKDLKTDQDMLQRMRASIRFR
jgi:hypothetical protein